MFSIFTLAIKFDCLFWAIFQSFNLFLSFILDQLAPPPRIYVSKDVLNHYFNPFPEHKTVSKVLKTWYFFYSAFWSTCQWGSLYPRPPGYATGKITVLLLVG